MTSNYDTFSDNSKKLVTITKKDGTDKDYQVIITSTEQSGGAKDYESIPTHAGGRLKNYSAQEDYEITLEGYAVESGTASGTTGNGFGELLTSDSLSSQPISLTNDHSREEYRLALMRTDNFSQTSAADATTTVNDKAMRWVFQNGHFTNVEVDDTDNVVKFTINYKCPPFDKDGNANYQEESTDGTAGLSALSAYTSS